MIPSKGDDLEHPVTEQEAVRSVLVQGLPLLDQELTESSIVQVCGRDACTLIILSVSLILILHLLVQRRSCFQICSRNASQNNTFQLVTSK